MSSSSSCGWRRRAAVAVLVVLVIPVLIAFAALTVDVGYLYNVRADAQHAADSAALAGASGLFDGITEVRARAQSYAAKNRADGKPVSLNSSDIQFGNWDADEASFSVSSNNTNAIPDAVRVTVRLTAENGNPVDLFFANIFGLSTADVGATATATYATGQAWDVVIVQDVTGSFKNALSQARVADQALLDCIRDHTSGETQVGLVTFTGYGWVVEPLQTIETGYDAMSAAISSIDRCGRSGMPPCSGTNIGAGIDAALGLLAGVTSELPPAMIIVGDGLPNSSLPGYSDDDLADWAVQSADDAEALGISIFTLFYSGGSGDAEGAAFLSSLIRGEGTAHETPDPTQMDTELATICLQGLPLVLVE